VLARALQTPDEEGRGDDRALEVAGERPRRLSSGLAPLVTRGPGPCQAVPSASRWTIPIGTPLPPSDVLGRADSGWKSLAPDEHQARCAGVL
jgi:hypothetical protein